MKYLELDQCSDAEKVAKFLFKQAAEGIQYLHNEAKIAHRDIKPENIFYLDETNRVKIGDYTLGLEVPDDEFTILDNDGSLPFQPPECFANKPYKPKPMDVWALGITIYAYISL